MEQSSHGEADSPWLFMQPEISLPCSEEPTTGLGPESFKSSPHPHILQL